MPVKVGGDNPLEAAHDLGGGANGGLDVLGGVGGGDEAGFELAGGEVDAGFEHSVEEFGEPLAVAAHGVAEVPDRAVDEVAAEHGADALAAEGDAGGAGGLAETGFELGAALLEAGVGGVGEGLERGQTGGHGEGVTAEGTRLVDRSQWGQEIHDVGTTAKGAHGQAAADDFAEAGEVGDDTEDGLGPAGGEAEAGHDFVGDEEGAVVGAEGAEAFEEAGFGQVETGVGGDEFEDDGGEGLAFALEEGFEGLEIVEGQDEGVSGEVGGDARAVGLAEGECAGAGFDQEGVSVPVVTAVELEDVVPSGEAAGEAERGHAGLGSGAAEADFLDRGNVLLHAHGKFDLGGIGNAEAGAAVRGGFDGGDDRGRGVTENGGAPGTHVIDQFHAVDGSDAGATGGFDEEGLASDRSEGAHGGVDASGQVLEGFGKEGGGTRGMAHRALVVAKNQAGRKRRILAWVVSAAAVGVGRGRISAERNPE